MKTYAILMVFGLPGIRKKVVTSKSIRMIYRIFDFGKLEAIKG